MSLSPVTCQFTVVSSRHSCDRKVMSVTHSQVRYAHYSQHLGTNEPKDNFFFVAGAIIFRLVTTKTNPRTIGKISIIKKVHSKLLMKQIKNF